METALAVDQTLKIGDCVTFKLSNGKFGGGIVCKINHYRGVNNYFLLLTDIFKEETPELNDFQTAHTFGRPAKKYLDDILILWDGYFQYFKNQFYLVGNLDLSIDKYRIGAYRHQQSYKEFDESVVKLPEIDYLERKAYPIQSMLS